MNRWPLVFALVLVLLAPGTARADKVDDLAEQLRDSSSYKVRLSAALTLTKLGAERAIDPLIEALADSAKSVRGVAAAGLGKVVTSQTSESVKKKVMSALADSMKNDSNDFVRRQAKNAYNKVKSLKSGSSASSAKMYVDLGPMSDKTGENETLRQLMRKTVEKSFGKKSDEILVGDEPSASALKKMSAYHVDGTITSVSIKKDGSSAEVSCKVSMLMATYPKKSMFAFLDGGARVEGGSSAKDIGYAKEDCVAAVVEDLISRKVIPTLEGRAK